MGNYSYNPYQSGQQWRPQQNSRIPPNYGYGATRSNTGSFGNQPSRTVGSQQYDPTQYTMSTYPGGGGGNDPTSTADVNRPTYSQPTQGAGSGSTASNQNNQPGNGYQSSYSSPHPSNAAYVSEDGLVSYDRYGRRLDSNGNVATGSAQQYGSSGGGGGAAQQAATNYWQQFQPQPQAPNPNSTIPQGYVDSQGRYHPSPQEQAAQQAQQPRTYDYMLPFNWQQYAGAPEAAQATAQEWSQMQLPYQQFMQNALQYGMDFGEAQRRWDLEYGRNLGLDQWQQGFADRQQTSAEQQAMYAQQNWREQMMHTAAMDNLNYGLQSELGRGSLAEQIRAAQAQEMLAQSAQGIGMQQWQGEMAQRGYEFDENLALQQGRQNLDAELGRGNLALQNQQALWNYDLGRGELGLAQLTQEQRNAIEQGRLGLDTLTAAQQNALATGRLNLDTLTQAQRYELERANLGQQNQQYYAGLSSQERMQGNELANRYGFEYAQMGQQGQQFQQQLQAEYGFKQHQLDQQAALEAAAQGLTLQQIQQTGWYQQQQAAIQRETLAQEQSQFGQSFGLQQWRSQQDVALQQAQLAQQAMLERERMASQERQSNMAAFGRSAAPNVRWLRQT